MGHIKKTKTRNIINKLFKLINKVKNQRKANNKRTAASHQKQCNRRELES